MKKQDTLHSLFKQAARNQDFNSIESFVEASGRIPADVDQAASHEHFDAPASASLLQPGKCRSEGSPRETCFG